MLEILTRITEGKGKDGDIELLEDLANQIKSSALCGLGQTAPNPVLTTIKYSEMSMKTTFITTNVQLISVRHL